MDDYLSTQNITGIKRFLASRYLLKSLILLLVIAVVSIILWFFYNRGTNAPLDSNKLYYYELKPVTVNLNTSSIANNKFLKIDVVLALGKEADVKIIKSMLPSVTDACYVFLRQLRSSDVSGVVGIQILKDALRKRINKVIYPIKIKDILFTQILLQ